MEINAACVLFAATISLTSAFVVPSIPKTTHARGTTSALSVAADPKLVTTKEYEDICGDTLVGNELARHLERKDYLYPKHVEVIEDIAPVADAMVSDILLECGENSWQPQDYLPDMDKDDWMEQVKDLRDQAAGVPDDIMVVLVGDMVTEEALPTYQTLLNTFEGCDDPTGATDSPWARWSRGWTSEENRHGDLLNKYLYLGGKCDMRAIEVTIQHLITSGFDPGANKDPYKGFVYTSFQERATKVSHGNVGKLAKQFGDKNLQKICAKIAGDEARHERAYQKFVTEILKRDPDGIIETFAEVMRGQIVMPAELMNDGVNSNLYEDFSEIAQNLGVYTAIDYAEILEHLVKKWDLENITGLGAQAEADREYLCNLPARYMKLATRSMNRKKKVTEDAVSAKSFSWIHGRCV